jgi:hypothetical protein
VIPILTNIGRVLNALGRAFSRRRECSDPNHYDPTDELARARAERDEAIATHDRCHAETLKLRARIHRAREFAQEHVGVTVSAYEGLDRLLSGENS